MPLGTGTGMPGISGTENVGGDARFDVMVPSGPVIGLNGGTPVEVTAGVPGTGGVGGGMTLVSEFTAP